MTNRSLQTWPEHRAMATVSPRWSPCPWVRTIASQCTSSGFVVATGFPVNMLTAVALARHTEGETEIVMLHIIVNGGDQAAAEARAHNAFRRAGEGIDFPYRQELVHANSPAEGIVTNARQADILIIGATQEPLFKNLLMGNVTQQVADEAQCLVIIVKRRSTMLKAVLRETVLPPVHTRTIG